MSVSFKLNTRTRFNLKTDITSFCSQVFIFESSILNYGIAKIEQNSFHYYRDYGEEIS